MANGPIINRVGEWSSPNTQPDGQGLSPKEISDLLSLHSGQDEGDSVDTSISSGVGREENGADIIGNDMGLTGRMLSDKDIAEDDLLGAIGFNAYGEQFHDTTLSLPQRAT